LHEPGDVLRLDQPLRPKDRFGNLLGLEALAGVGQCRPNRAAEFARLMAGKAGKLRGAENRQPAAGITVFLGAGDQVGDEFGVIL
jgi:hypothetical protein